MIIGGAQETAKYTAEYFQQHGDHVLLVAGEEAGREGHFDVDVPTITLPSLVRSLHPRRDLQALVALYRIFRREKPDVVHSRTAKARFLTSIAARLARVPVVVQTVHGWSFNNEIDRRRALYIRIETLAARFYHRTVLVSETDLEEGVALGIVTRGQVALIRSGVNLARMRAADPERVAALRRDISPAGGPLVLLVGRLSMPKTPDVFVRAAALVRARHPLARFVLVGDGEKRESLQALIDDLGLHGSVTLLGLRSDVPELMSASDVVVHSSTHEGLPKTVLEAVAAGKPVVGTRVGGVPQVIDDGTTGLLVDPLDHSQLAAAIDRLLSDPGLGRRLAAAAAARLDEFSLERTFRQTDRLYQELLASARR
jgi:glycosyltransferase involved in cell wall biosynthesis